MKSSCLPLCLLLAVFSLFWTPSAGLKTLHLGSCVIATNLQEMQTEFSQIRDRMQAEDEIMDLRILKTESSQDTKPADQCCLLRHILRLYLGMVFKNYQTSNKLILQKLSSLANSFLTIKKDLRLCHARMTCPCGEEAMEKFNQILSRFEELKLQEAVVKALGELDILLQWMGEMR
ncbi:interleukin-20 [Myotis lucifugus]|uniref:Interleukin family protein n=1 Tax=Myotis lucifugus TaxID=59463 RepID=G1PXI8_MYOLU|nr:interleukin-20 [Myotis lucifugus]XP_006108821.1 interleukin-20-like [Myotis lucifugus]XP_014306210.1 interleukin-20-like [Myotis lucifugus]XP_014316385.1 interleukin-20 [Myotis lucifugus]CAB0000480.1 TPA: interferon 2D [Myotis lucifugus]